MARKCCQTKKGGLFYVNSIRTYSGGHEWCEAEAQCGVALNADGGEARCFCRGAAREKLDAPEAAPAEMVSFHGGSRRGIVSALVDAALFFAGPRYASAQYDAADRALATGGRTTSTAASSNRARGSHGAKNFYTREIDGPVICSESCCDRE